jgi:hypothetical protein
LARNVRNPQATSNKRKKQNQRDKQALDKEHLDRKSVV